MTGSAQTRSLRKWSSEMLPDVQRLYAASPAKSYGISEAQFARILDEVTNKYLPPGATVAHAREMVCALRVDELVLARGCAAGNDAAWEHFLTRFREKMYGAAYSIAKQDSVARELADSLYANLYGMTEREGERLSKLASYMGRGSLEGWLRTVLAQEYVNRYRSQKRLVSLEEEEEAGKQFVSSSTPPPQNGDARVSAAVDEVLSNLGEEERYCLAAYFLDDRTLADIARSLGVHESTISRKLEKITKGLRSAVISTLVKHGMDRRAAQEALDTDVRDLAVDVRARLGEARKPAPGKGRA